MKISSFFKILNRKIEKYNRVATNPFTASQQFVLVWIEEADENNWNTKNDIKK